MEPDTIIHQSVNIPLLSASTCLGHFTAHIPQLKQAASSITAQLSITRIASAVHVLSQIPHPMQLDGQTSLASLPLSLLEHFTTM